MQYSKRPTGVTIIAFLNIIGGIVMVFAGLALVTVGAIFPSALQEDDLAGTGMEGLSAGALGVLGVGMGGILVALGIVSFVVAYGLLKGKGWAWMLTVVLSIISIALNAISIATGNFGGIISIIISVVILYYLYRPHVKSFFGRGPAPTV